MTPLTRTEVTRIPSSLGDVILQRDHVAAGGELKHREITMFVPSVRLAEKCWCGRTLDTVARCEYHGLME